MIKIEDKEFEYRGYLVQDKEDSWEIVRLRSGVPEISKPTDTEKDAKELIDQVLDKEDIERIVLPARSITAGRLRRDYPDFSGIAYVLVSKTDRSRYATRKGIGNITSPDIVVYRDEDSASRSAEKRTDDYDVITVHIVKGNIRI